MSALRVMVADDSNTYRAALCDILRQVPDVEVTAIAQDGVEALKLVRAVKPDALLLDIEMPKMNGWEVLQRLQTMPSPPQVLVISSHSDAAFRQQALNQGACAYISKGNPQQVIDTIHGLTTNDSCEPAYGIVPPFQ